MSLARLIQIHTVALAFVGTLLLGLAERSMVLTMWVAIVGVGSVFATDIWRVIYIPRSLGNVLMLAVAGLCFVDFVGVGSYQQLVVVGRLLTYVQLVMLLQLKTTRVYGQIFTFSLLQVIVASLLSTGYQFGVLLIVYSVLSLFALSLFFLYRELERFHPTEPVTDNWGWLRPWATRLTDAHDGPAASGNADALSDNVSETSTVHSHRPVVAGAPAMSDVPTVTGSQATTGAPLQPASRRASARQEAQLPRADEPELSSSHEDLAAAAGDRLGYLMRAPQAEPAPSRRPRDVDIALAVYPAAMAAGTLMLTMVYFLSAPRADEARWRPPQFSPHRITGFSQQIYLNDLTRIMRSEELVMRVRFTDPNTGKPYIVRQEPYFRGAILTAYQRTKYSAKWTCLGGRIHRPGYLLRTTGHEIPAPPRTASNLVKMEANLELSSDLTLFHTYPSYRDSGTPTDAIFNPSNRQLERTSDPDGPQDKQYRYTLLTTAFERGVQRRLTMVLRTTVDAMSRDRRRRWRKSETSESTHVPPDFDELAAVATRAVEGVIGQRQKAVLLESYFKDNPNYEYTLDFTNITNLGDDNRDPIVDFVVNHRTGHCELFSSALVMMLRTQQIPARLVVGYRGGELNSVGDYYKVRQLHAHAWVEAFLDADDLPAVVREQYGDRLLGAWLRLDPTPGNDAAGGNDDGTGLLGAVDDSLDYAQMMWNNYVLGLDANLQGADLTIGGASRSRLLSLLSQWTGVGLPELVRFFDWRSVLTIFGGVGGLVLLVWGIRHMLLRRRTTSSQDDEGREARQVQIVVFYERLETLLAKLGLSRLPSQTQREFAHQAVNLLAAHGNPSDAGLPMLIVDLFYQLRFGNQSLSAEETRYVDAALERLELIFSAEHSSQPIATS